MTSIKELKEMLKTQSDNVHCLIDNPDRLADLEIMYQM